MGTDLGGAVDIVQTTSYYPFGLVMNQYNGNTATGYSKNKYLYNGKELQDDKMTSEALDWFDYGARLYDPQIGRWTTVDPHAERYYFWSPYNYVADNPIKLIDPDGKDWYQDKNGNTIWYKGSATVAGYKDIGAKYTTPSINGISISYTQNKPTSMAETVLSKKDFSSQMVDGAVKDGKFVKKSGDDGNCFTNTRKMVAASGATMSGLKKDEKSDNIISNINKDVDQGHSVGVHVNGTHWVAITSRTTDLTNGQVTSFGFADPSGRNVNEGMGTSFSVNSNGTLTGSPAYNSNTNYIVVGVQGNE